MRKRKRKRRHIMDHNICCLCICKFFGCDICYNLSVTLIKYKFNHVFINSWTPFSYKLVFKCVRLGVLLMRKDLLFYSIPCICRLYFSVNLRFCSYCFGFRVKSIWRVSWQQLVVPSWNLIEFFNFYNWVDLCILSNVISLLVICIVFLLFCCLQIISIIYIRFTYLFIAKNINI